MSFMNDYEIDLALRRFNGNNAPTPNRFRLAETVANLASWADNNSDGWAYWPKPGRAASKATALIASTTFTENEAQETTDATDAETTAALRPIKAFLTRQGVPHEGIVSTGENFHH